MTTQLVRARFKDGVEIDLVWDGTTLQVIANCNLGISRMTQVKDGAVLLLTPVDAAGFHIDDVYTNVVDDVYANAVDVEDEEEDEDEDEDVLYEMGIDEDDLTPGWSKE